MHFFQIFDRFWQLERYKGQQGKHMLFTMLRKVINTVFETKIFETDIEKSKIFKNSQFSTCCFGELSLREKFKL